MTIGIGSTSTGGDEEVDEVTVSHETVAGKGRLLMVGLAFNNSEDEVATGVTYDGVAMTFVAAEMRDNDSRAEQWMMYDPPVGTFDVVATLDAVLEPNNGFVVAAISFTEVNSADPLGASASAEAESDFAEVTVASAVGDVVLDTYAAEDTGIPGPPGAGQTEQWNTAAGSGTREEHAAGSTKAGASPNVTMEWDIADPDKWALIATSIQDAEAWTPAATWPKSGDVDVATPMDATAGAGTDPAPVYEWTIGGAPGGGSGVWTPSDAVLSPSFEPDTVGTYFLQLKVITVDQPDQFTSGNFESESVFVAPTVDAGGPYNGDVDVATALNATVTPGSDPTPVLTWTIDSGPGGGVFLPSASVEDPTFTPDAVGSYVLKLEANPSDGSPVSDTANFESDAVIVAPTVDAGGPYAGDVSVPIALNGTVTPGSDPAPTLLWTIDSGGTGTFSDDTIEDPTFTADVIGAYVLRLTVTPSDGPDVFDTAALTTAALADAVFLGGRLLRGGTGDLVMSQLSLGADPPGGDVVYVKGTAHSNAGAMYVAVDDGVVARVFIAGIAHQHNGVRLVTFNTPVVNLNAWGLDANGAQSIATSGAGSHHEGILLRGDGHIVVDGVAPIPPPPTAPPALPDLQHWFDYSDGTVVFADLAGVVPITLGTNILRVNNKGYEVDPLLDNQSVSAFPDWALGTNGKNVARNVGQSHSIITLNPASVNASGVNGIFSWAVYKVNLLSTNVGIAGSWQNFGGAFAQYGVRGDGSVSQNRVVLGTQLLNTKAIVLGEWVLTYSANDTTNVGRYFTSGVAEATVAEPYIQVPPAPGGVPGNSFTSAGPDGDTLMWGVYDRMLTPAEIGVLIAYIDNYLGTALPFVG